MATRKWVKVLVGRGTSILAIFLPASESSSINRARLAPAAMLRGSPLTESWITCVSYHSTLPLNSRLGHQGWLLGMSTLGRMVNFGGRFSRKERPPSPASGWERSADSA